MTVPAVVQTAISHYLDKGLSKDTAVGIVAVLYCESKLAPGSQGNQSTETPGALNPGGAFGIASWNGPRQAALAAFAQQKGLDPGKLETQLDFVLTESANSYPKVWEAIQGGVPYSQLIPIFVASYENPADHQREIAAAMAYADAWYPLIDAAVIPPTPQPTPPVSRETPLTEGQLAVIRALATGITISHSPVEVQALAFAILKEFQ